jgi:4-hydroxy-tetrahydrodipicolinate synthase
MPDSAPLTPFGSVLTAMITPFTPEGALDIDGAVALAKYLVAEGSNGLVVAGSTGESTMLDDDERISLWECVASAVAVPVVAGSTTGDTRHSVALTQAAEQAGVAGILATTPYYSRPSQSGIAQHFQAVATATKLPVVMYDIPSRTGRALSASTMLGLANDVKNIVGLKDAGGNVAMTARLLANVPSGFSCYSGDDSLTLPLLSVGACGVIGVATHWCAKEMGEMIEAFFAGDVARATSINRALIPSFVFESSDDAPNPVPTKAVLRSLKLPAGQCRLPLGDAPAFLESEAMELLDALDKWRVSRS